jgi:hypothetical protein
MSPWLLGWIGGVREGSFKVVRNLTSAELQERFPKLKPGTYTLISKATARYNCVAFVNDDERHWWEPGMYGGRYHWPNNNRQDTLENWCSIFRAIGYEETDNQGTEPGYEKVAIYVSLQDMLPSHVARSDGKTWKSKLGKGQDLEHYSLEVFEGDQAEEYGIVTAVFRRAIK